MAKRKTIKRASKKTSRAPKRAASLTVTFGLFEKHKNLKWLLPLLAVALILTFIVHHYNDEPFGSSQESGTRQNIENMMQNHHADDNSTNNSTAITPTSITY